MSFISFINGDFALTATRIVLASVMIYYGFPKIKNLQLNGADFEKMGFRPGVFWGTIVALVEFFGGIMMFAGFYSGIVAVLFGAEMATGAVWKITKTDKTFRDWSYDIQLLAMCLVIISFGPGQYAIGPII